MTNDIIKKLEELDKRLKELESKKDNSNKMFGRAYQQVGNTNSDFLIKTRGQVKIQLGNKFIDLIKDGKINIDSNFVFTSTNVGVKEGIYILEDGSVWLKPSYGNPIPIVSQDVGTTYVSFLEEQKTPSDLKHNAMTNIGFLYPNLQSIDDTSLQNGIIYVESEEKLYIIKNGAISEYTISFPNPYNEQFIIAKSDDGKKGALFIQGKGINNSLAFDGLYIYNNDTNSTLESRESFIIKVFNNEVIKFLNNKIESNVNIEGSYFSSKGATQEQGFRLYISGGESFLEVDNLITRNMSNVYDLYPEYWFGINNFIKSASIEKNSEENEENLNTSSEIDESSHDIFIIETSSKHNLELNDTLITFIKEEEEEEEEIPVSYKKIVLKVDEVISNTQIKVSSDTSFTEDELFKVSGGILFLISRQDFTPLHLNGNVIEGVTYDNDEINFRIGDLNNLELKITKGENSKKSVQGSGIYSKQAIFESANYVSDIEISDDDNSSTLASTKWVRKIIKSTPSLPIGAIIAYHGDNIPAGWAICDGTNNTPNLVGKFIKGGSGEEIEDIISVSSLDSDTPSESEDIKIDLEYYSLVFIMKIQ